MLLRIISFLLLSILMPFSLLAEDDDSKLVQTTFSVTSETLDLNSKMIGELYSTLGQCAKLKVLRLGINYLRGMPHALGQLINLETLDLGHNRLEKLPSSIGQCIKLESLDLDYNALEGLPYSLKRLANLTTFRDHMAYYNESYSKQGRYSRKRKIRKNFPNQPITPYSLKNMLILKLRERSTSPDEYKDKLPAELLSEVTKAFEDEDVCDKCHASIPTHMAKKIKVFAKKFKFGKNGLILRKNLILFLIGHPHCVSSLREEIQQENIQEDRAQYFQYML